MRRLWRHRSPNARGQWFEGSRVTTKVRRPQVDCCRIWSWLLRWRRKLFFHRWNELMFSLIIMLLKIKSKIQSLTLYTNVNNRSFNNNRYISIFLDVSSHRGTAPSILLILKLYRTHITKKIGIIPWKVRTNDFYSQVARHKNKKTKKPTSERSERMSFF